MYFPCWCLIFVASPAFCYRQACRWMQSLVGLSDLGQFHRPPFTDSTGSVLLVAVRHVTDRVKNVNKSAYVRWAAVDRIQSPLSSRGFGVGHAFDSDTTAFDIVATAVKVRLPNILRTSDRRVETYAGPSPQRAATCCCCTTDTDRQTDGRTDTIPMLYVFFMNAASVIFSTREKSACWCQKDGLQSYSSLENVKAFINCECSN